MKQQAKKAVNSLNFIILFIVSIVSISASAQTFDCSLPAGDNDNPIVYTAGGFQSFGFENVGGVAGPRNFNHNTSYGWNSFGTDFDTYFTVIDFYSTCPTLSGTTLQGDFDVFYALCTNKTKFDPDMLGITNQSPLQRVKYNSSNIAISALSAARLYWLIAKYPDFPTYSSTKRRALMEATWFFTRENSKSEPNQGEENSYTAEAIAAVTQANGTENLIVFYYLNDNTKQNMLRWSAPAYGSIGNFVWKDVNKNGIQDAGEQGVSGVQVTLKNSRGETVSTTTTNQTGNYSFLMVPVGTGYTITFALPDGYGFSPKNQGSDPNKDSDPLPNGIVNNITVAAGTMVDNIDAGIHLTSLPVSFATISAIISKGVLNISWNTSSETNNSHFEIQASTDGFATYRKIGTVNSAAVNGNSNNNLQYNFSITENQARALMGSSLIALLAMGCAGWLRRKKIAIMMAGALVACTMLYSCSKSDAGINTSASGKQLSIRIAQVDKNGQTEYSKVYNVVNND